MSLIRTTCLRHDTLPLICQGISTRIRGVFRLSLRRLTSRGRLMYFRARVHRNRSVEGCALRVLYIYIIGGAEEGGGVFPSPWKFWRPPPLAAEGHRKYVFLAVSPRPSPHVETFLAFPPPFMKKSVSIIRWSSVLSDFGSPHRSQIFFSGIKLRAPRNFLCTRKETKRADCACEAVSLVQLVAKGNYKTVLFQTNAFLPGHACVLQASSNRV